ncbi:lipopolysaccharide-induced tumor necrosis factor-alpha factor homolog [Nematostella vectensis]|uniref:lipopolysaccharide-induced tumor necrosis factor-alpha factor homolog n=1 Tax=Nematostella vectensis TaxID=45351 RepID=UPI0020770C6C|nr:lipopolysaccharide-induced tumor necrosis factor-alpha factor homolog [Nematostella vectensis]
MSDDEKVHLMNGGGSTKGNSLSDGGSGDGEGGDENLKYEDVPVYTTCPFCQEKIVTRTSFKSGKYTYWTSACLCIFQCYCCVWIPFILDGLKNVVHTCPKCGSKIAEYSRLRMDRIWKKKKKHRQAQHSFRAGSR